MSPPHRRSRLLLWSSAGLVGVAVAAVVVWLLVLRDTAQPVSVREAIEEFESQEPAGASPLPGGAVPEAGVYVYETTGFEQVDILLGSRHEYPPETTITVSGGGCGLLQRWTALEGRSTTWELCPSDGGWSLRGYRETHSFFGQTEHTDYRCETETLWWPVGEAPGTTWTRLCTTGTTTETSRGKVVGFETVAVGDEEVEAVRLHLDLVLAGRTRGTGTIDTWLDARSGVVLRLVIENDNRSHSAIGDVRYEERVALLLESLEPRR